MNITPIAFLMISEQGVYDLVPIGSPDEADPILKIADLIEKSPQIAQRFKDVFSAIPRKNPKTDLP